MDAVRYDVTREHATLLAFVRGLAQALAPVEPALLAAFPALERSSIGTDLDPQTLVDWLLAHVKGLNARIVIDDVHLATLDARSGAFLTSLIERSIPSLSWILSTRTDVGFPVATWMAYGNMDLPIGEDDLRFTLDEALATADAVETAIVPDEIDALRELTQGWPVALSIALRTRTHAADLRGAAASTRDMVYRYLAEQIYGSLSLEQRDFLMRSSVFSSFDADIARRLGASDEFLTELRRNVTFMSASAENEYRYHDLFREFLDVQLRKRGTEAYTQASKEAAALCVERGNDVAALSLLEKIHDEDGILHIVERSGFPLLEEGCGEALTKALSAVSAAKRTTHVVALGVSAMVEANRGNFELASRQFTAAIERAADEDTRLRLVHRYGIELVRMNRDPLPLLEPVSENEALSPQRRMPILGTLATAYATAGRIGDALGTIARAMALVNAETDERERARLLQQASYVEQFHDRIAAKRYAEQSIELSVRSGLFDLAARAYSVLFTVTYDENDDPIFSLTILDKLRECAIKGASNQARLFGVIASYGIEAERGDEEAMDRLERELDDRFGGAISRARGDALLPARALRLAWNNDAYGAFAILRDTDLTYGDAERRALRASEIAVYGVAAGQVAPAEEAIVRARTALESRTETSHRTARALTLLALAELQRGHLSAVQNHLTEAERTVPQSMRRLRALIHAVRQLYRRSLGQIDDAALIGPLERLDGENFGGYRRLLGILRFHRENEASGYAALTPAEREILEGLVTGASTKDIAAKTGRSPHTIDTHIRSICRKLDCSGRREAVALATREGWVQSEHA